MRLLQAVFFILTISCSYQHEIEKRETKEEKRVVCYYTNWSVYRPGTAKFNPQNINPYLCTHLIYAFGGLDRENGLRPYDKYQDIEQGGYAKFTGLKTYNKNLKTMLAIGGWNEGSARFSPLVADEERRKEFVKNVVKFLRVNHFDGLDLDWEYPAFRDGGKPHDKENYAQLVQELREEFERESSKTGRPRLLLTMAVPAGLEYVDKGYDIPKLNRFLDFMNILSYDYHSAFEPSINHHSPLYSLEEAGEYNFDSQLTIDATVKHYLSKGADANKLVLGIPTYGRSYTLFNEDSTDIGSPADGPGEQGDATREKGYLAYYEICANVKSGWTVRQPKESAMGPYAYKGNQWVGYDDEAIVKRKSEYVNEQNLGGIMFWSIDNDDFRGKCSSRPYPLIEAAKEALLGTSLGSKANKLPSSPRGGKTSNNGKLKATRTTTSPSTTPSHTTPDPPTTPDPGSDFVCKDEGFFPHPRDCKKYFWCLDSGPSNLGIVAHQFTCPSGLFFNKAADSCDFARNVICKKKSSTVTTTTEAPKTTKSESAGRTTARTTTTTSTTTEPPPEEEAEEYIDERDAEDPQTIKQLISLIKKLGGVAELEKQLDGGNSEIDVTTPIPISKSLYQKVINRPNKFQPQRNGPSGPQNEGLPRDSGRAASFRKDRPKYVTIQRERPSTSTTETSEEDEEEDEVEEEIQEKPKYREFNRNRGSQNEGIEAKPTERSRPKYQPIERFRQKSQTQDKEDQEETQSTERSTTLRYKNIFRSRSTPSGDSSTATTSRYVTLQRQRHRPEDEGTTENKVEEEESTEEIIETTTTTRPRIKVSDVLTTTPGVRTSTRVVTQVVEGATQRQRVPLHKLQQLFKDSENLIETVTKPYETSTTEKKLRPILNSFQRKRTEIVVTTTTTRSTPAYLRRNRIRSSSTTTEVTQVSKRKLGQRRFRPTTEVATSSEGKKYLSRRRNTTSRFSARSTTESSQEPEFTRPKSRYFNIRPTTTERSSTEQEDGLFTREYSRESNVIRRPVQKHNETTSTLRPETSSLPSGTNKKITQKLETTTEIITTLMQTEAVPVKTIPTDQPVEFTTPTVQPVELTPPTVQPVVMTTPTAQLVETTVAKNPVRNRTKIILRRRKPVDSTGSESSGDVLKVKKSEIQSKIENQQLEVSKDKKRVVVRRKKLDNDNKDRRSRGRTRFSNDPADSSETEKSLSDGQITSRNERRPQKQNERQTTRKPERLTTLKANENNIRKTTAIQTEKTFKNEKISRGRKKFVDELNEDLNNKSEKSESPKTRRVVYKKTIKDLAVGESGIPGSNEEDVFDIGNSTNVKIWNSLAPGDINNYFDTEEIQRVRRPAQRRPVSRSTTTSTTESSITPRQRTTVQSLKLRLNRFKTEKTLKSTSPITEVDSTTIRSRKSEFRRLIKQHDSQRIEEEPKVQYHRQTSFKPLPVNRDDYRTTLIEEQATESTFTDEHITDERGVITYQESNDNDELGIGDLANVAVAAIQSLATSPPTQATEQYKVTTTRPTTRIITTQRIRSRPTRPPTPAVSTTPAIIPTRSLVRSSPRPFSKVTQSRNFPSSGPAIYDDYEDYYAEPIDVPLSGKVRIHNDGYIECLDIGNFPHPFSCRKFISCAKMENGHLLGWEYTCPKGLSFDPIGGICNWNAGLGCKE